MNIARQLAALQHLTVSQLKEKYLEVTGEEARSHNKAYLIKRVAWQMQAKIYGGLSQRALDRAKELAQGATLRSTPPKKVMDIPHPKEVTKKIASGIKGDNRLPMPGAVIRRDYKGEMVLVTVLTDGFEYQGETYRSLSAVAKAITGSHWNGYHFFGLNKGKSA